jgi:hypothetical protein
MVENMLPHGRTCFKKLSTKPKAKKSGMTADDRGLAIKLFESNVIARRSTTRKSGIGQPL